MEQALEGSRPGAAPGEGEAPREPKPRRHRNSNRSGVVVSRPSVIVGSPGRGQERSQAEPGRAADRPASERPAKERSRRAHENRPREGIFGQDLISEKSLDEVILAYLSEDSGED